jgi:hypothetical protein
MEVRVIGIDIAKCCFQIHRSGKPGAVHSITGLLARHRASRYSLFRVGRGRLGGWSLFPRDRGTAAGRGYIGQV